MKIFFSAIIATISLASSALARTNYVVAFKNVGHVNSNGIDGHKFDDKRGPGPGPGPERDSIMCHEGGCVGEGVIMVRVDESVDNGELNLEVFPTLDNFAVSIMCQKDDMELSDCTAECSNRGGGGCRFALDVIEDTTSNKGCTIVGDGAVSREVEITVRCQ